MDMATCPGPSRTTIANQHILDPPINNPDSCAKIYATELGDGMCVLRVFQANPHHHKVTQHTI